jgi:hypothetical protein
MRPGAIARLVTLLALGLAGCAVPFGSPPQPPDQEPTPRSMREQHRLYLEEQQRLEWQRQRFEPYVYPSER